MEVNSAHPGEKPLLVIGGLIYVVAIIFSNLSSLNPFLVFLSLVSYLYGLDVFRCYIFKKKIHMGHFDIAGQTAFNRTVFFILGVCLMLVSILYLLELTHWIPG